MKQKLTLTSVVLLIIETVFLFMPFVFTEQHWKYDSSAIVYHGIRTLKTSSGVNIFGVSTFVGRLLAFWLVVLMIVSIVALLFMYMQKKIKGIEYAAYAPLAPFVFLIINTIYVSAVASVDSTNWYYNWTINWMFFVVLLLHILASVFSLLTKFKKWEEPIQAKVDMENVTLNTNSVEQVKQLKELLDSGAITQEEFDKKKSQILGL